MVRLVRQKKISLKITGEKTATFLDVLRIVDIVQTDGVESPSIRRFRESWAGDYRAVIACPISVNSMLEFDSCRIRRPASANDLKNVSQARIHETQWPAFQGSIATELRFGQLYIRRNPLTALSAYSEAENVHQGPRRRLYSHRLLSGRIESLSLAVRKHPCQH